MDHVGHYAVQWADDATSGVLQSSGNYADNTCFTLLAPSQDWRGVPPVYYPADNRKLDLYAYYPYRPNAFLPGTTSIGLTVQANQSAYTNYTASDFVVAKREGIQRTFDKVNLSFSHKLSQMVFQLKNGDGFTLKQLQTAQITIKNVITDARYNLGAGNFALPEVGDIRNEVVPYGRWAANTAGDKLAGVKAVVMPQELNSATSIEITLGERTFVKKFSTPLVLNSGESRLFTITLNNNGGSAPETDSDSDISTELNPWESGVPVEDEAEEVVVDPLIVTAVVSDQNIDFTVTKTSDIIVDWGDGSQDTNVFQHHYVDDVTHTIRFYGNHTALTRLDIVLKGVTALNVSSCIALDSLNCCANQLTTLDVSRQVALRFLDCQGNFLTTIDVTNNTELQYLDCRGNQLTALDLSYNEKLIHLFCFENQLSYLNLEHQIYLERFQCMNNQLRELRLTNNRKLVQLICCDNQLISLDLSYNHDINYVDCHNNPFLDVTSDLLNFAHSLPDRKGIHEPGSLRLSSYDVWESEAILVVRPIAASKNWSVD